MDSTAAAPGGDAHALSATTSGPALHSSSDAYSPGGPADRQLAEQTQAAASEQQTGPQMQTQTQTQPQYYPSYEAAPPPRTSFQSTTTTAPSVQPPMSTYSRQDESPPPPELGAEEAHDDSQTQRRQASNTLHIEAEQEDHEAGWGLPQPVQQPVVRALCLVSSRHRWTRRPKAR